MKYYDPSIVIKGDLITLYVATTDDVIEFVVGDKKYRDISSICIGMAIRDSFEFCGEKYIIQYIERNPDCKRLIKTPKKRKSKIDNTKVVEERVRRADVGLVGVNDFIVRTNIFSCSNQNHTLKKVNAVVNVIENGKIVRRSFPGMYCVQCDKYFVYESTYQMMKNYGYICCRVIKRSDLSMYSTNEFGSWKQQSLLSVYGYSVEKNRGLSIVERQNILAFLIENKILSITKIVDYLESFIALRKNNKNMALAISKWKTDINFVLNYKKTNVNIRVNSLIVKNDNNE